MVERLAEEPVDMMEINISCPNVKAGGLAFRTGCPSSSRSRLHQSREENTPKQPVIMKLTPECDGHHRDGHGPRRPAEQMRFL